MVWPSIAGTTMERRDHVLMTFLVPLSFWTATFLIRWSSTKGPFFRLRGIVRCSYRFFLLRRRTIIRSLDLLAWRVRPSGLPHGLTGGRPPELLPSPPPRRAATALPAPAARLAALARPPSVCARGGDAPGRPPARRWRGQEFRWPSPGQPVGQAGGAHPPGQQIERPDDRPPAQQEEAVGAPHDAS